MGEYFRGWRRKAGVVTLVMACALASAWLRSFSHWDRIEGSIPARLVHGYIVSWNGQINIIRRFPFPQEFAINRINLKTLLSWRRVYFEPTSTVLLGRPPYGNRDPATGPPDCWTEFSVMWRVDFAGFHFGEGRHHSWVAWKVQLWSIPYWTIVIPLTLLSAYLLLIKPRAKPAPKADTP